VWCLNWEKFDAGTISLQRGKELAKRDEDPEEMIRGRYQQGSESVRRIPDNSTMNERIRRQRGIFTHIKREIRSLHTYLRENSEHFAENTLVKICISSIEQSIVLRDLALMGLDPAYLMFDLEGVAHSVYNQLVRIPGLSLG
jgi:hypothetical protein